METVVILVFIVLVAVGGIGMVRGIDLTKWSDWLYALCPFLGGVLIGLLIHDLSAGLTLGAISVAIVLYCGSMSRWQRQRYEKKAGDWLLRNEGKKALSLLSSLIRKLNR